MHGRPSYVLDGKCIRTAKIEHWDEIKPATWIRAGQRYAGPERSGHRSAYGARQPLTPEVYSIGIVVVGYAKFV